jgi:hypothetical protein
MSNVRAIRLPLLQKRIAVLQSSPTGAAKRLRAIAKRQLQTSVGTAPLTFAHAQTIFHGTRLTAPKMIVGRTMPIPFLSWLARQALAIQCS